MDDMMGNIPTMEERLAVLRPLVDDLHNAQHRERDLRMDAELMVRIFNFGEAYEKLVDCVERIRKR